MSWNRASLISLLEQLEMCVSAGLPVPQTLNALGARLQRKKAATLANIASAFESGQPLSVALSSRIRVPPSIIGLIVCGETSGSLAQSLKSSHELLARQDELVKKIISSLAYPVVIGIAAVAMTIGLVQGIMPQIIPLFSGLKVDLPLLTKVVVASSRWLIEYGLIALCAAAALSALAVFLYRKTLAVRRLVHICLLHAPVAGRLVRHYHTAIFFQSFGSMVNAGVLADEAFEKSVSSIDLIPLRAELEKEIGSIRRGGKFQNITRHMPVHIASLVSAGEASGNFGTSLLRVTSILSRELDHAMKRLTSLIEPAMMLGMGTSVGSVALSIMLPIYDISKAFQH